MCRFGTRCKFILRNACAYKHANENCHIRVLKEENKVLQNNISDLKNDFQLKVKELEETTNSVKDLKRQLIDLKKLLNEEKDIKIVED